MSGQRAQTHVGCPSVAQKRVQCNIIESIRSFLRGVPHPGGGAEIRELLREELAYSGRSRHTLPLGSRAGVPAVARGASVHDILKSISPELSRQVLEPQDLLFKPSERPARIPRPFIRTDGTYKQWVLSNVKSGFAALS